MVKRKAESDLEEEAGMREDNRGEGGGEGASNDDIVSSNDRREPQGRDPEAGANSHRDDDQPDSAAPMEIQSVPALRGGRAEEMGSGEYERQGSSGGGLSKQGSSEVIAQFDKYADQWFYDYRLRLEKLKQVIRDDADTEHLEPLVKETLKAIEEMFSEKRKAIDADVLHVMAGLWRTPLEVSFLWHGGLRPTTIFQLIYHMVGSQIENSLGMLLSGGAFPPMASLTGKQLEELSSMQLATTKIEDSLSDDAASLQMNLADLPLPGLANPAEADPDAFSENIQSAMHERLVSLRQLVHHGDDLRLETVKRVLACLTVRQQVELLAGMSELVLALRKIGETAKVKTYI